MQALKDGKIDKDVKNASANREKLSKDLVQATSEMTNKKTALQAEIKALEAVKKVISCLVWFGLGFLVWFGMV